MTPTDIRICFIGDSFVNGTGDNSALGWVGRLSAQARADGINLTSYNLGIRRDTSRDILARWQLECEVRLPNDCDSRIVISCGVNDTVIEHGAPRVETHESLSNLRTLFTEAGTTHQLLMVGPPPIDDAQQNEAIGDLSRQFDLLSQQLGIPYIELYPLLVEDQSYRDEIARGDGAHPGEYGYTKLAQIISSAPAWWF